MKSRLAINLEYAILRGFCAVANAVPYRLAMALARFVGWVATEVLAFQRERTMERLRTVFPRRRKRELRWIARRSLTTILENGVEMMRSSRLDRDWMDQHVCDGRHYKELLQEYVDEGNGAVIMVPHCGNWYMAAWAMARYGLPLFAIAARQRNPKLDAWLHRQYGDIEILDRNCRDTLGRIREKLRAGRAFAILPDLRVRKRDIEVDFLGGKANVSHAGAMFAVHVGAPVVVAAMRREKGKHVFAHLATLRPNPAAKTPSEMRVEAERITREAMKLLSDFIMKHPDEWFWYNKRWILEPPIDSHNVQ